MAGSALLRAGGGRDPQLTRMVGVSAALHAALVVVIFGVLPVLNPSPLPIVAYTVELTDSSSLGGRLAPGKSDLPMGPRAGAESASAAPPKQGEPDANPAPPPPPPPKEAAPVEPEPPKPVERAKAPEPPKPEAPAVKLPSIEKPPPKPEPKKTEPKKSEAKKPEPKPEPKADPKADPKSAAKPADGAKAAAAPPKPAAKPGESKPADAKPAGKPNGKPDGDPDGADAYASAAAKWRTKAATGGGGGLGGTDTSPGPMGTPGYGGGGGGQVVGFEFLAYQQRVVTTVKGVWTNVAPRPGLVAKVRFNIAPNGEVSGVRMEQPSGNGLFDTSAMRAVERADPLPPPPARYVNEFRDFVIEFHSEEGGQASG
jgi:TolA protein